MDNWRSVIELEINQVWDELYAVVAVGAAVIFIT